MATQLREVHVGVADAAELALRDGVGVREVAAERRDVGVHESGAGGAGRGVEMGELDLGADDARVGEADREHAVHEVGEGTDAVHEYPEAGEGGGGGEDTDGEFQYTIGRGWGRTYPQKIRVREKSSCAMFPAVSAVSIPATTISVNVEVKIRNAQTSKNIRPPRS